MMEGFFSHSDYAKLFDEVVLSGAVGIAKPVPAIFELTCKRLGVELNEAVMIDDMQSTVDFVRTLGMKGICYKDFEQFSSELETLLRSQ
jgi:HAD superfamily hydrolase (TIGR01509 family)